MFYFSCMYNIIRKKAFIEEHWHSSMHREYIIIAIIIIMVIVIPIAG